MLRDTATILHLSDLHLGENFDDPGRTDKATLQQPLKIFKKGAAEGRSHDPYILCALPIEVRIAARQIGARDGQFDFHVITGDISDTANSEERFVFARQFLLETQSDHGLEIGLNLPLDRVLCVPGNHDKMTERNPARYLKEFKDLPATPPYVRQRQARNGRKFIFYGIDSNDYTEGNIGVGRIEPEVLAWLGKKLSSVRVEGNRRNDAARILLLHHHPCDLTAMRPPSHNPLASLYRRFVHGRFTRLDEGERLLEQCRGRIDIIMHGHEHFPVAFKDDRSGCLVVSAGTTAQFENRFGVNSFHALVFSGNNVRVAQFDWNGARFKKGNRWKYNLRSRDFSSLD